jgi:hypothetical protein
MRTPHKHATIIKAWADGAEIEFFQSHSQQWKPIGSEPCWFPSILFRIKPEPKPDVVYYGVFDLDHAAQIDSCFTMFQDAGDQIKVTFDGETGKLKKAEVL